MAEKRWHTREDSGIRLDRQLRWWHDDEPVEHPRLIEAFNRGLRVADDGRFKLEIGDDWCFVAVEDAAFGVVAIDVEGAGVVLRLSDRTAEVLVPSTLSTDDEGVIRCWVKAGKAPARFSRDAQFALGNLMETTERGLVLKVSGSELPTGLGRA